MSSNLAVALPRPIPETPAPYIEVAPSREQRRARPKLAYALIVVGGLFTVLVCQLLLSMALADGAYSIAALQAQQKELNRDQQIASEHLGVLSSPQNLAARAEALGMVSNNSAAYLNLANGAVLGVASAASANAGSVLGSDGVLLVPNMLVGDVPASLLGASGAEAEDAAAAGVSDGGAADPSVTSSPDGIPAPTTH